MPSDKTKAPALPYQQCEGFLISELCYKTCYRLREATYISRKHVPFTGGGDGSRTHVRKEFSVSISGCRRSTTFPPRHAGRQANASVAS